MHYRSLGIRVFLVAYIVLLLSHLFSEAHGMSFLGGGALLLGIAIALYAHTRSGLFLFVLLCIHMSIEWFGHGLHHFEFVWPGSAYAILHVAFDVTFLFVLARTEWPRTHATVFSLTLVGLALLSIIAMQFTAEVPHTHESHDFELLEFLIFGGILGCTAFHLLRPLRTV